MRTALAALFAAAVVAAVAVLGWQSLSARLDGNADRDTPQRLFDDLAAAWEADDRDALAEQLRSGQEQFFAALDRIEEGLAPQATTVEVAEIDIVEDGHATAVLEITVETGQIGALTWTSTAEAIRRRGTWTAVGSASAVHPEMEAEYTVEIVADETARAPIVGHDGESLTAHGENRAIGVAPQQIVNEERLRVTWASVLPESLEDLVDLLERDDLNPEWFYPVVTVSQSRYDEVWPQLRSVPGILSREAESSTPTGESFARHVIGRVGEPTAELADELGVPADSVVGLYGLERVFEDHLVGSEEVRVVIRRPSGDEVAELASVQDDPSAPLHTTLDRIVQEAVENALAGVEREAAVVVVDPATGGIRATASRPLEGYNRAWEGLYAPGDAFVPVTATALIGAGVALDTSVACPAEASVVGAGLTAPRELGDTTAATALAAACDPAIGTLAADLDAGALADAAAAFGFGVEVDLPLPAALGVFPEPADRTEQVRAGVGQARVQASPLHLASVAAAVADGQWRLPYVLAEEAPDHSPQALPGDAAARLQSVFEQSAESGSASFLRGSGATGIAGTAPETGRAAEHAWVIGLVDGLAFAVLVEDAGATVEPAAGIAERFVRELAALRG